MLMVGSCFMLVTVVSFVVSVAGVLISFFSLNLMGVWVGMELNFLASVCFMVGSSVEEGESVIKYYIIQVLGSGFSVMGMLLMVNGFMVSTGETLLLLGMLMKLGMFPFHFWVGPVVSKMSWPSVAMVLLIQKLIPLWVIVNCLLLSGEVSNVELLCALTSVVGCLAGLNVLNYRVLVAMSSLTHLGCLVMLSVCEYWALWVYFLVYSVLSACLMWSMWCMGVLSFQDLMKESGVSGYDDFWWVSMYFLSVAGLPPFTGCVMKSLFAVTCWEDMSMGTAVSIMVSCISLFFYLSVELSMVVYWGKSLSKMSKGFNKKNNRLRLISMLLNIPFGFMLFLMVSLV
uniref:NADH dehydrogenase subunit 2 n=1 Tax=Venerupis aspera TaxID=2784313 RepID=UPI001BEEC47D|nr:NADH dehydrogenase subunit 2 [Venerupis aspera]YP_010455415.1 NADH dehydrogenase subunit 2 [Ruditapes variegatus]QUA05870.1 NADH dehydrogenase subunit 2 [Venerupis aspera]UUA63020.1 NADH dehydrogenase subunit 2 [Ruditapes variegatus]